DESLKSHLAKIKNPELQNELLSSILENGHFSLLNESLCKKDSRDLLNTWSNWMKTKDANRTSGFMNAGIAAFILHNKNSGLLSSLFKETEDSESHIKNWKEAYEIYQLIEAFIDKELQKN